MNRMNLDRTDCEIIEELLDDGRMSLAELGRRVHLSPPAVADRVKRLEHIGVITGYRAHVDLMKLGYDITAFVLVTPTRPNQLPQILELARQIPQVSECHRITGESYLCVKLHLRSIDQLSGLLDRFLAYGQTTTSIINGTPIPPRTPPIEHN